MDVNAHPNPKVSSSKIKIVPFSQRGLMCTLQVPGAVTSKGNVSVSSQGDSDNKGAKRFVSCNKIIVPERVKIPSRASQSNLTNCEKSGDEFSAPPPPPRSSSKALILNVKEPSVPPLKPLLNDPSALSAYKVEMHPEGPVFAKPPSDLFIFLGLFTSFALVAGGIGYIVMGFMSAFDKRGKEAYFLEDPDFELSLLQAVNARLVHPTWTLKTDDWGYFKRAYDEDNDGTSKRWADYNVFFAICVTSAVCGGVWIITNCLEVWKFGKLRWGLTFPGPVMNLANLLGFVGGNYYILRRLQNFKDDTITLWKYCNCPSFKTQFFKATNMYFYSTLGISILALLQLIPSLVFICLRPQRPSRVRAEFSGVSAQDSKRGGSEDQ